MVPKKEKIPIWRRYWWVFIGAVGAVSLASALNFTSNDGWIEITMIANDTYDLGWNSTRPTVCSTGYYSYWNGTNFLCAIDGGGSGGSSNGTLIKVLNQLDAGNGTFIEEYQ